MTKEADRLQPDQGDQDALNNTVQEDQGMSEIGAQEIASEDGEAGKVDGEGETIEDAGEETPGGSRSDNIATPLMAAAFSGAMGFLIFPSLMVALLVAVVAGFFGWGMSVLGLGFLSFCKAFVSKTLSCLEKVLMCMMMLMSFIFPLTIAIAYDGDGPKAAAREIASSALSQDAEMSRDAMIMEKQLPGFVTAAFEAKYGKFDEVKFFMLKEPSVYETVKKRSSGLACFKSGQWRAPVVTTFDMTDETVKFSEFVPNQDLVKDLDLMCYKIANGH